MGWDLFEITFHHRKEERVCVWGDTLLLLSLTKGDKQCGINTFKIDTLIDNLNTFIIKLTP